MSLGNSKRRFVQHFIPNEKKNLKDINILLHQINKMRSGSVIHLQCHIVVLVNVSSSLSKIQTNNKNILQADHLKSALSHDKNLPRVLDAIDLVLDLSLIHI